MRRWWTGSAHDGWPMMGLVAAPSVSSANLNGLVGYLPVCSHGLARAHGTHGYRTLLRKISAGPNSYRGRDRGTALNLRFLGRHLFTQLLQLGKHEVHSLLDGLACFFEDRV